MSPKHELSGITECLELKETLKDIYGKERGLIYGYNQVTKIIHGCDLKIILYSQILRCSIK